MPTPQTEAPDLSGALFGGMPIPAGPASLLLPRTEIVRPLSVAIGTGRAASRCLDAGGRRGMLVKVQIAALAGEDASLWVSPLHSVDGAVFQPSGETAVLARPGSFVLARPAVHRWVQLAFELRGTSPSATFSLEVVWTDREDLFVPAAAWLDPELTAGAAANFEVATLPGESVLWEALYFDAVFDLVGSSSGSGTADGGGLFSDSDTVPPDAADGHGLLAATTSGATAFTLAPVSSFSP